MKTTDAGKTENNGSAFGCPRSALPSGGLDFLRASDVIFSIFRRLPHWKYLFLIILAGLLSALITFFCRGYYSTASGVEASFILRYENQKNNHLQIFYLADDQKNYKCMSPVLIRQDGRAVKFKMVIPCKTLHRWRLDFGRCPRSVRIEKLRMKGQRKISLKDMRVIFSNQLSLLKIHSGVLTCFSAGNDPYVYFALNHPLRGKVLPDYWIFSIIAVTSFIISCALLSVVILTKHLQNRLYFTDLFLVIVFLAALAIPFSALNTDKVSEQEKRKLAEYKPLIGDNKEVNFNYGKNFDAWFNDRFCGRPQLLNFNHFLFSNFTLPRHKEKNYKGPDDWFFYAHRNALKDFHNLSVLPEKVMAQAAVELKKLQALCAKSGKRLYLIIVPDKSRVYSEYFPASAKIRSNSYSRAEQLIKYLQDKTTVPVIYLLDTLMKNKSGGLLYIKNNTHWSSMGAYIGYLEIMKHLKKDFPELETCAIRNIQNRKMNPAGDLSWFGKPAVAPAVYPQLEFSLLYKVTGDLIEKPFGSSLMSNPKGKRTILMLRDSFASSLLPYMGQSFKSITALWSGYNLPDNKIRAFQEADILIFECVERNLATMISGIHKTRVALERGGR